MKFRKVLALRGPNLWATFPVLEAWVELGDLKDASSDEMPGFNDRVMDRLPTLIEHRCSVGTRGGFFERLRRGTYPAHVLEHVTLELQSLAGSQVGFGRARATSESGTYRVAVEYEEEELARAALDSALDFCLAAVDDRPFDVEAEVGRLRAIFHRVALGPSTRSIVRAARRRGIPVRRLNAASLVQLGHGARQRRILASETDRTGAIAEWIAQDKEMTRTLLAAVGVPVPQGRPVSDVEDAWAAAEEIGPPVVVKPQHGNQGRGVAINLRTRDQVVAAYEAAREESSRIIVERFAPGADYRVLVVGDRVVAASLREPAQVVGDGVATIATLVERVNQDPRRSDGHATALSKIPLDAIAMGVLAEQGYSPESVPPAGSAVLIRRNANLSTGGTAADVTDLVHPEVAARAVEAARMVGLDVAGVDVVAADIGRPLEDQGGAIVEVNAAPGLRMHLEPSVGTPRKVGRAIVDLMFPESNPGRIPIVGVTGVNGKTTVTRLIAHILGTSGRTVGMTCTDGVYVGGRRIEAGDCSGPASAGMVLMNPAVEAAVLETARGGILRAGLAYDRCDVAVVTNIGEGDHLGLSDIRTPEELAQVKRTVVEVVDPEGAAVLNADDPLVAAMSGHCPGRVVFFARSGDGAVVRPHLAEGGRAVVVRGREIILAEGASEVRLTGLDDVPLTLGGRIGFQVENALAAAAAAWSLGLAPDQIRVGLSTFTGDTGQVPGRFNRIDVDGATVIVDYGHNPSAVAAMVEAIGAFPHPRRTIAFTGTGDRRDHDLSRQGHLLGDAFDRVVLYEEWSRRGREPGEIVALLRAGLASGGRVREVAQADNEADAIAIALRGIGPGDLIVIQADQAVETTLALVRRQMAAASGPEPGRTAAESWYASQPAAAEPVASHL